MKTTSPPRLLAALAILLVGAAGFSVFGQSEAQPDGKEGGKPGKVPNSGKRPAHLQGGNPDPFAGLAPEQREKLREAVRRAWNDPAVIQARDEVKAATDAYQNALKAAIDRSDPETAQLIEKYRQSSQTESKGYLFPGGATNPGRANGQPGGLPLTERVREWRDFESFLIMENPPFLRDLDDEKKRLYREAHRKAMETEDVRGRVEQLKKLRQEDDEFRKKRTEAIRGMHVALRKALIEAEPRVAEFMPTVTPADAKKNQPGGDKEKDQGKARE